MPIDLLAQQPKNLLADQDVSVRLQGRPVPEEAEEPEEFFLSTDKERANWQAQGSIGWWEYAKLTKFSDVYYGEVMGAGSLHGLVGRLQNDEYKTEKDKDRDKQDLYGIMKKREEMQTRGMSYGANVYKVVAQIPSFAFEMAATGGLASSVRKTATAGAKKAGLSALKKGMVSKAVGVLGREAVVGAARTTVMPHRYMSGYAERQVNDVLSITDKGLEIAEEAEEAPFTSFMKAYGDAFVEFYTETLGGELLKPASKVAAKGILAKIPKAAREQFTKIATTLKNAIPKGRIAQLITRGGFDGILEEYGEERLGSLFRIPLGLDEREIPTIDKLQEAIFPTWEQAAIEIGAFAIWGGSSASAQAITNGLRNKGRSEADIKKTLNNLSQKEKDTFALELGKTFDERAERAEVIIKASSGGELTAEEQTTLDTVYKEFVDKGLIEKEEEVKEEEKPLGFATAEEYVKSKGETVYHGTSEEFETFDAEKLGSRTNALSAKEGFFFTDSKQNANVYSQTVIDDAEYSVAKEIMSNDKFRFRNSLVSKTILPRKVSALGGEITDKEGLLSYIRDDYKRQVKDIQDNYVRTEADKESADRLQSLEGEYIKIWERKLSAGDVKQPSIKEVVLSYDKPLVAKQKGTGIEKVIHSGKERFKTYTDLIRHAKEKGHDAVIIKDAIDPIKATTTVVFKPSQIKTKSQLISEWNKAKGEASPQSKAQAIVEANAKEVEDKPLKEQAKLIYQGREKALDRERISIEKEMSLIEKQIAERKQQDKPTKALENKLQSLSDQLESVHYQIADIEDVAIERLKGEGIEITGKQLERIRKLSFRTGKVQMREEMLERAREKKQRKKLRYKAAKDILKKYKRPENVVDVKYQQKIDAIVEKLGATAKERKKSIRDMSDVELVTLAKAIAEEREKGKELFKTKKAQREMAAEVLRGALIKAAGGTPTGQFTKGTLEEKKKKKAGFLKQADLATLSPVNLIRKVFGEVGERLLYDSIDHAATVKGVHQNARKQAIQKSAKTNKINIVDLGKVYTINGKSFQLNNILRMYLATKDGQSMEALLFGNNISESEVAEFIKIVPKKYLKFADEVQQVVGDRYDEIARVMAEHYNVKVEKVKTYFPLRRIALGLSQEEINDSLETEMAQEQVLRKGAGFSYTTADKGNTISRIEMDAQYQTEISLDFFGDAMRIIDKQEHLISYAPLQKAFNKVLNDPDLQEAVKYNYSESTWRSINEYLVNNVNPDTMFKNGNALERYVNHLLKRVRKGVAKAYLIFSAVTSGKQLPSFTLAAKYTNPLQLEESMRQVVLSKKYREAIYNLDPSLRNRVISRDFNELMTDIEKLPEGEIKRELMKLSQMVDTAGFAAIMQMDKYAVLAVYDAVYRHQKKTKSEKESQSIAHKAVLETQPQGGVKDLPAIYRTNQEYLRMALMFTNQLNKIWNMMRADMPRELARRQYGRASLGIASIMISSTMIYIMSHGRLPEDFDDFIDAIFGSMISSIPIVGNIGMSLARGYTPSLSPMGALTQNIQSIYTNISDGDYQAAMADSTFLLAIWLGLPYSQAKRTLSGAHDLATGETSDIRRLIWSEYMLGNN